MRRVLAGVAAAGLAAGGLIAVAVPSVAAPPVQKQPGAVSAGPDELSSPQETKRRALRQEALTQVLNGQATPALRNGSRVVKLSGKSQNGKRDRYVELARERTDKIFVILAEFGDQRDPNYPDQDTDPATAGPTAFDGPLHNQIPAPDRTKDNSTVWQADYNPDHYRQLYFGTGAGAESLKTYYETQSSGRYSVNGMVSDWVKVPYNEARYGRSNGYPCAGIVCSNTWDLIRDALVQWVADQRAAGQTDAQIASALTSYDQWDRYDYDGDGNFNEPDGYIDHFQIVHAGGDQADADPQFGEDAIWSHRWAAYQDGSEGDGPANDPIGGVQVGNTGLWVRDYTIQPENGGLSVFAHEYGHDLGLPDDYDTAGGPSNNNEWWTLMAQSRLRGPDDLGIGTRPGDIGAWQKLQLGWLDYEVIKAGQKRTLNLGPEEYNSAKPQAAVVVLPKKTVTTTLPAPPGGSYEWWSQQGDDLDTSISRSLTLPAGSASLSFQANWNIEDCGPDPCDYAYVEVDDGSGFTAVPGSITNAAEGNGIDGISDGWVPATFDLTAYAGQTVSLRFRYVTDGAAQGTDPDRAAGLFVDDIAVTAGGSTVFTDTAETLDPAWTVDGWIRTDGTETKDFDNYYIAGNRSYVRYDRYLRTGPYNFGFPALPDKVEFFPYQTGLLVSYWDTSQTDNNVSVHPGEGLSLYVDAHPAPIYNLDGTPWRNRIQLYDAPFSLVRADSFTLHNPVTGNASLIRGQNAQPLFDDTRNYDIETAPGAGVKLPKAGVKIRVVSQNGTSMRVAIS